MEFTEWMDGTARRCHVCQFQPGHVSVLFIENAFETCVRRFAADLISLEIYNSEYKMEIACYPVVWAQVVFFFSLNINAIVIRRWLESSLIEFNCLFSLCRIFQNQFGFAIVLVEGGFIYFIWFVGFVFVWIKWHFVKIGVHLNMFGLFLFIYQKSQFSYNQKEQSFIVERSVFSINRLEICV